MPLIAAVIFEKYILKNIFIYQSLSNGAVFVKWNFNELYKALNEKTREEKECKIDSPILSIVCEVLIYTK